MNHLVGIKASASLSDESYLESKSRTNERGQLKWTRFGKTTHNMNREIFHEIDTLRAVENNTNNDDGCRIRARKMKWWCRKDDKNKEEWLKQMEFPCKNLKEGMWSQDCGRNAREITNRKIRHTQVEFEIAFECLDRSGRFREFVHRKITWNNVFVRLINWNEASWRAKKRIN